MQNNKSPRQRAKDLAFLRAVLKQGGPHNIYDRQVFFATRKHYPLELWYLCQEYHPSYYSKHIRWLVEEHLQKINASLN